MHCYFVDLNCIILLNKVYCVDKDKLGWDSGWFCQ